MLFLDGVGLGKPDSSMNPFFAARLPALRSLFGGEIPSLEKPGCVTKTASLVALDANLGVDGLPQSGTGQTALFTGVNASKLIGKHFGPHPYSTLRPVLQEKNIFKQLISTGRRPSFANAFPQRFFDYMDQRRSRLSVTTLSCTMSGIPLLKGNDLREGRGVSADITSEGWKDLGYPDMPTISPAEAGRRLVGLVGENDFVLFEYWKTDHAGHAENFGEAVENLERFDGMLGGIVETMDIRSTLLFITSDHGNIEDMSTKTHTRNPVPAIFYGLHHEAMGDRLHSLSGADLTHVTPLLMEYITGNIKQYPVA
jgi:hypothetical protein